MLSIYGLIGVPGSGKSTFFQKNVLKGSEGTVVKFNYQQENPDKKWQPIALTLFPSEKKAVFGIYEEGEQFPGTDKLSKSCGPSVRQFLKDMANGKARNIEGIMVDSSWSFFWEGERFTNNPFFQLLVAMKETGKANVKVDYLSPDEAVLARNRKGRVQDAKWLQGMETRVSNIYKKYGEPLAIERIS